MKNRLLFRCCTLVCLAISSAISDCYGEILYDDLRVDGNHLNYELTPGSATLEWGDDGLNFVSSQVIGVRIGTEDGFLPEADTWSFRAHLTVNQLLGLGLAGVVVADVVNDTPSRWAGVLSAAHDQEYGVGQNFDPEKLKIEQGEVFDDPFVVQLDFSPEALIGHFWRPETPTEVTTIERSRSFATSPGEPRFANNGTDSTYHQIWISRTPLPLPTGFEEQGDLNGNKILELGDVHLLQEQIGGAGATEFDLNADGTVDRADLATLVEDYLGTQAGDVNLDGRVDFVDFLVLSEHFGGEGTWQDGDFDSNGRVDFPDFLSLSENYASSSNAAAAVPEPSAALLTALGLFGIVTDVRRRRRIGLRLSLIDSSLTNS